MIDQWSKSYQVPIEPPPPPWSPTIGTPRLRMTPAITQPHQYTSELVTLLYQYTNTNIPIPIYKPASDIASFFCAASPPLVKLSGCYRSALKRTQGYLQREGCPLEISTILNFSLKKICLHSSCPLSSPHSACLPAPPPLSPVSPPFVPPGWGEICQT